MKAQIELHRKDRIQQTSKQSPTLDLRCPTLSYTVAVSGNLPMSIKIRAIIVAVLFMFEMQILWLDLTVL